MLSTQDLRIFDFFLMSYDEPGIPEKLVSLRKFIPNIQNVHGVKGEFNAWRRAAERSSTPFFTTIDADTEMNPRFSFQISNLLAADRRVHVWRSMNPVNGLVYGHGSIHLFSKAHILSFSSFDGVDFTLGAATEGFCIQEECATTTRFNVSPFLSWRAGFKEAAKLASQTNLYPATAYDLRASKAKLKVWCSTGMDAEFGEFCILGALMGALFGFKLKRSASRTFVLGNYDWFHRLWKRLNVETNLDFLIARYREKLSSRANFEVPTFAASQSRALKELWYSVPSDVIRRLSFSTELNY